MKPGAITLIRTPKGTRLLRCDFREHDGARLGGAVGTDARRTTQPADCGIDDEGTSTRPFQCGHNGAEGVEDAAHVECDGRRELLGRQRIEWPCTEYFSRIRQGSIEPTIPRFHRGDTALHTRVIDNVDLERGSTRTDVAGHTLAGRQIPRGDGDPPTLCRQSMGRVATHAATTTQNQRHLRRHS
jgi:hypothetical protein